MTDEERARHAVARVFNRYPEAPTALRSWCETTMQQEFAAVRREERERCASIVEVMGPGKPTGVGDYDEWTMEEIATAIREQSE